MGFQESTLHFLQCPSCGGSFQLKEIFEETNGIVEQGQIACNCGSHPICFGILVLKNGHLKDRILTLQRRKAHREAAVLAQGNYCEDLARGYRFLETSPRLHPVERALSGLTAPLWTLRRRRFFDDAVSFSDLLGNGAYHGYLRHRFSAQSFWTLYPFFPFLGQRRRVLEICCGAGHASYVISRALAPSEMICLDGNFKNLFFLRKFFSPAKCILADASFPLPFRDGAFDLALMMDAFHYVESQYLLSREIERVVGKEGGFLILHVHSSMAFNFSPGKPVSPFRIPELFHRDLAVIPEPQLLHNFLNQNPLDLITKPGAEALEKADAFCVAANIEPASHEKAWDRILNGPANLRINPLYETHLSGDHFMLTRRFPSETFRREYPLTEAYLPDQVKIGKDVLHSLATAADSDQIRQLRKKFVLLDLPDHFLRP